MTADEIHSGLVIGGEVVPGYDWISRHSRAWWDWEDPRDRPDLRKRPPGDVTLLVGHWTAGPIRTLTDAPVRTVAAMKSRERVDGTPMSVSVHFVIGWDGGVWQTADLARVTVHAGGVSSKSVGVECCWPGTAEQASAISGALARRVRDVHPGYLTPPQTRLVRGHKVRCLPPSVSMLEGWIRLAEGLSALPASYGIVIPRQIASARQPRGAMEHCDAPRTTKVDAAGYLTDVLALCGWRHI